jgi:hypothetical protein
MATDTSRQSALNPNPDVDDAAINMEQTNAKPQHLGAFTATKIMKLGVSNAEHELLKKNGEERRCSDYQFCSANKTKCENDKEMGN